jgi:ActR/RegA family two-component response regulator
VGADDDVQRALAGLSEGPGRAVLIVEPSPDQQARLARLMAVHGHRAIGTSTLDGALAFLRAFPADLVLLAEEIAGDSPLRVVAEIVGRRPNARIAIMTPPASTEPNAPDIQRFAALDYVPRSLGSDVLQGLLS